MPRALVLVLTLTVALAGCLEARTDDRRVATQAIGAPSTTTLAASLVTDTTATLNGGSSPGGVATTGWFRYATTSPTTCTDSFGTRAPATGGVDLGSGTTQISYAQAVSGLAPGTTYYFCAIATNADGWGFGSLQSFTTLAPPATTTSAAFAVTSSAATLKGAANPNGASTTGWFRYATTDPGTCDDLFGVRAPATGGSSLGSGTSAVSYTLALGGLVPATTYWYCAIASNALGTSFGSVLTFTTPAAAPAVTTSAATLVTGTTAQLNGLANPGGAATTGWFRYSTVSPGFCNDTFGSRVPTTGSTDLGSGTSTVSFSAAITGLAPGTDYYVCAIASSSVATAFGSVVLFRTPRPPTVSTQPATNFTGSSASLEGWVNPNGASTSAWFRYSTTNPGTCDDSFGTRVPATGAQYLGSGTVTYGYSFGASVAPGTTYWFCAIASSPGGTSFGSVLSFTAPAIPTTSTASATSVTSSAATLNGSASPNGASATGWFRYATTSPGTCNDTFGVRAPATGGTSLGSGWSAVSYSQALGGLAPGTTYYVCAVASNAYGTSSGALLSFTTSAAPPTATTSAPTSVTGTTAQLNGSGNPGGAATTAWFRYGTTSPGTCNDTFGVRAPAIGGIALGSGAASIPFSQDLTGLTPGTTYYACAITSSAVGTAFGALVAFTTPVPPTVSTVAATSIANTSATLMGTGNPSGSATTGWFRYSTTNPGACDDTFGTRAPASGGSALGSGTTAVAYTLSASGLAPGTTHWFCAIAASAGGTAFGAVQSFTTHAAPTTSTAAATSGNPYSATLNGSAIPNGSSTTGWFRYSTTNPGSCSDTFGTRAPSAGGTSLGSGTSAVSYSQGLSGLAPVTTYYYCAVASNAYGASFGAVLSFTTAAAPPSMTTDAPTLVTGTTVQLNGSGNPGGAATTAWFRYGTTSPGTCNDAFGTRAPASGGADLGSGTTPAPFSQGISGLAPGTTYYACAVGASSGGTGLGNLVTFTTPVAPAVSTAAATGVTASSATLNGSANPNRAATTAWFRYSTTNPGTCDDTFGTRAPATGGATLGAGSSDLAYSESVVGLAPGTTYWFCAVASNAEGSAFGALQAFTTPAVPPTVATAGASAVSGSAAILSGSANPGGAATTAWFRYSTTDPGACDDAFGTRAPASGGASLGSGTGAAPFSQAIAGLSRGTTYYVCAIASNSVGTSFGAVVAFTTPDLPAVTTEAATGVTSTGAVLEGTANPKLAATTGWFRWSGSDPGACDDTFGTRVPASGGTALDAGAMRAAFAEAITGLAPGATYWFCAIAANAEGTSLGEVLTFTALAAAPSVTTSPPTGVTGGTAVLHGAVVPHGDATTAWFRYGSTDPGMCDDAFGVRIPASGGFAAGPGLDPVPWSETLSTLTAGAVYYYCAIASNGLGTSFGGVVSFSPGVIPPAVATDPATLVTATGATLGGSANPNGSQTSGWFRYGTTNPGACDDSFGTRVPASGAAALGRGTSPVGWSEPLAGLEPNLAYYFCAAAASAGGAEFGAVRSFTTDAAPPVARTAAADVATDGAVTLRGAVDPRGAAATGWFRYDSVRPAACDDAFGVRAPSVGGTSLGSGRAEVAFSQAVSGLRPGTYHACAIGSNAAGLAYGEVLTFTVPEPAKSDPGGCGCRAGAGGSGGSTVVLAVLLLALGSARRRTPSRPPPGPALRPESSALGSPARSTR